MGIDIIVLIVLIVIVLIYSKRFQTYIFGFGMIDIVFRILNVINGFLPASSIKKFISNYVPSSIPNVIEKYLDGVFSTAFLGLYVIIMIIFLYYIIAIFIKRKKI